MGQGVGKRWETSILNHILSYKPETSYKLWLIMEWVADILKQVRREKEQEKQTDLLVWL